MHSRIGWSLLFDAILTLCSNYCIAFADDPLDKQVVLAKPLVVREVCKANDSQPYRCNGTLTFDGKEMIVVEPHTKLSFYNVMDLSERIVSVNPLIVEAWSDSATGAIFVKMESEKNGDKEERKRYRKFFDLLYFDNANDLLNWQPKWSKKRIVCDVEKGTQQIRAQWVSGAQLFALQGLSIADNEFTLIDMAGNEVGEFKLPGPVFGGFDTNESGIEAYFLSNDLPRAYVMRGVLDSKRQKVKRIEKMLQSQFPPNLHTFWDTRPIRLRGLKPGDVRRYIEWTNQPFYLQHHDHENIGLEPAHRASLMHESILFPRWREFGVLSYAESPYHYEIVHSTRRNPSSNTDTHFPPFLYRRYGELVMLPNGPKNNEVFVVDALLSEETWVISIVTFSRNNGGHRETEATFSVCTRGLTP